MDDIFNADRSTCLKIYAECYGDEDLNKIEDLDVVRQKVYVQRKIYKKIKDDNKIYDSLGINDLLGLARKYNADIDGYNLDSDRDKIVSAIKSAKIIFKADEFIKKHKNHQIDKTNPVEPDNIDSARAKYELAKKHLTDNGVDSKNTVTIARNALLTKYGLTPEPIIMSTSDLENILTLDDGVYGVRCEEFINKTDDKLLKERYKAELKELAAFQEFERQRQEKEKVFISKVEFELEKLSKIPKKLIKDQVNQDFITWKFAALELLKKLELKMKIILNYSNENNIKIDKRSEPVFVFHRQLIELLKKVDET